MNAVYITAFLAGLRSENSPGAGWETIYKTYSGDELGSYNGDPRFYNQFTASRRYYRYLDQ